MTRTHRIRRCLAALLATVSLVGLLTLEAPSAVARTETSARTTPRVMTRNQGIVVNQINRSRTARNRHAIRTNGYMNERALRWAVRLRTCQCLQHRAAPFGVAPGWCSVAENVGRSGNGGTLAGVHYAFMRSSGHRENILAGRWTDLGVGVAKDRGGEYFVVHVFADYSC
jgi:uncharacterized protein YkwD